jgi:hypothetical protein
MIFPANKPQINADYRRSDQVKSDLRYLRLSAAFLLLLEDPFCFVGHIRIIDVHVDH